MIKTIKINIDELLTTKNRIKDNRYEGDKNIKQVKKTLKEIMNYHYKFVTAYCYGNDKIDSFLIITIPIPENWSKVDYRHLTEETPP